MDTIKKKRSRTGYIGFINKIVEKDLQDIFESYNDEDMVKLESFEKKIRRKISYCYETYEEIQAEYEKEEDFTADFEKYTEVEVGIRHDIGNLKKFISTKQNKKKCAEKAEKSTVILLTGNLLWYLLRLL